MTNFEKIKTMSTAELADWVSCIADRCYDYGQGYSGCGDCPFNDLPLCDDSGIKRWLESEVEE